MTGGFCLNLNKKSKNGQKDVRKRKKQNVFGGDEDARSKAKISITHVEEFKEKKPKQLVIKAERLVSTLAEARDAKEESEVKFGLINSTDDDQELPNDKSVTKNHLASSESRLLGNIPETTTEEEYEAVPVEDFGKAMLRGMGWDSDEEDDSKEQKKVKLPHEEARPLFMGIGAKAHSKGRESSHTPDDSFLPIVRVNNRSGERANS